MVKTLQFRQPDSIISSQKRDTLAQSMHKLFTTTHTTT